jgi:hypothetical protein
MNSHHTAASDRLKDFAALTDIALRTAQTGALL